MKILKFNRIFNLVIFTLIVFAINQAAESPHAWQIKAKLLKDYNPGIGPLNGVVRTNTYLHNRNLETMALTFGNSQVGSVFAGDKQGKDDIYWTFIPSLPIPCYKYFEDAITKAQPGYLILYLSDIDMTLNPFYIPLKYHNFSLVGYTMEQYDIISKELIFSKSEFVNIFFSELLKPLKESVFLKTIIDKAFFHSDSKQQFPSQNPLETSPLEASPSENETKVSHPDKRIRKKQTENQNSAPVGFDRKIEDYDKAIQKLIYNRNQITHAKQIEYNCEQLLSFCARLNNHGIETIIVDGQYHPHAYNFIDDQVDTPNKIIKSLCSSKTYLHHLPLEAMTSLDSTHYIDQIHFTKEGGKIIRDEIADFLKQLKMQDEQH